MKTSQQLPGPSQAADCDPTTRSPADPLGTPRISDHAVSRYRQRIDPTSSTAQARKVIGAVLTSGRSRPTPRHWMRGGWKPQPGVVFVYSAAHSQMCLVVRDACVVTVWGRTRGATSSATPLSDVPDTPRSTSSRRHARFNAVGLAGSSWRSHRGG